MQIVSLGDHLHEMSTPILWENKKNLINLLSAESIHNVVNNNFQVSVRNKKCYKIMLFLNNGFISSLFSDYLLTKLLK